jgi:predicted DsbA family dithiol-disulfide isomerase
MKTEIWSDVACPWCYIGIRNFEKALEKFHRRDEVEIVWRSFELDPAAKKDPGIDSYDMLAAKYGVSRAESKQMHDNVTGRAAEAGLTYNMEKVIPASSFDAHRLAHLAAVHGQQDVVMKKLFTAYFTEGKNLSRPETLIEIGTSVGLDEAEIRDMLEGNKYTEEVRNEEREAVQLGIRGVPHFVIERKYAISGAQPPEAILQALENIYKSLQGSKQ